MYVIRPSGTNFLKLINSKKTKAIIKLIHKSLKLLSKIIASILATYPVNKHFGLKQPLSLLMFFKILTIIKLHLALINKKNANFIAKNITKLTKKL